MRFHKEFIDDQFRGFETARDRGNNVINVRVKKNDAVIAAWNIRDSRHIDAVIADAIDLAIARGIVPAGTV